VTLKARRGAENTTALEHLKFSRNIIREKNAVRKFKKRHLFHFSCGAEESFSISQRGISKNT